MNIRQATQEDWEQILALIGMFPKELKQTNLTSYRSFFVADVLGEIVGCCSAAVMVLEDPADPNEIPKEMEIRSLAVKPGWEGQGIATMLVAGCEKRRLELRIRQGLALASEAARRVFEAAGYATDDGSKYALFKEESR